MDAEYGHPPTIVVDVSPSLQPSQPDVSIRTSLLMAEIGQLHYHVNDVPHISAILLFGLQQMLVCISSLLVTPYLLSNMLCAGAETLAIRLAILHGPSFAFLPALHTFEQMYPCTSDTDPRAWQERMQITFLVTVMFHVSGSLLVAVFPMAFLGITGLVGRMSKHIGPVTIVPILILLCIGVVPDIEQKVSLHWISVFELVLLIIFIVPLEDVEVPIPSFSLTERRVSFVKVRLFGQFPYLLGIITAWFLCWLLTITELEPLDSTIRTDRNDTANVFHNTPWLQIPFPLSFGFPKVNIALACGFTASTVAVIFESVGNYGMCAQISMQGRPPSSSINRAFVMESLGSMLAALMGVGTGVTTYSENIAIMQVTRVASRVTIQCAGVLLIFIGVFSKLAAFLAMIPEAIIGGVLAAGISMICGVAIANLQSVELRLSRNLTIMGLAVVLGCTVSSHFEKNSLMTGNQTIDDVLGTLLKIKMLVGGLIAFVLDSIAGGATRKQRGLHAEDDPEQMDVPVHLDGFVLPSFANRAILKIPSITKLPVVPSRESIAHIEQLRRKTKQAREINK